MQKIGRKQTESCETSPGVSIANDHYPFFDERKMKVVRNQSNEIMSSPD